MPNVTEADERKAYIESIVSSLGGRVSHENAERNLALLDLESLAQLSSRLRDAWERASAMVQTPGALTRKNSP